jgi:hypothetical protein
MHATVASRDVEISVFRSRCVGRSTTSTWSRASSRSGQRRARRWIWLADGGPTARPTLTRSQWTKSASSFPPDDACRDELPPSCGFGDRLRG